MLCFQLLQGLGSIWQVDIEGPEGPAGGRADERFGALHPPAADLLGVVDASLKPCLVNGIFAPWSLPGRLSLLHGKTGSPPDSA